MEVLSEPEPLPEVCERFPEVWERLTTYPHFLFLRLMRACPLNQTVVAAVQPAVASRRSK